MSGETVSGVAGGFGPDPSGLRRMRRVATALLVLAAAVFIAARIAERDGTAWAGYVRATAEAAMVGGVADWFAITALFRHPLRLRIPHTAIIPKRKDEIGKGLGEFVRTNFLTPDLIVGRLRDVEPARRIGEWLVRPDVASAVGLQVGKGVRGALDMIEEDGQLPSALERIVTERLESVAAGPLAARALEIATADGRHHAVVDVLARQLQVVLNQSRATLKESFLREAPWWVGEGVFNRLFERVQTTLADVAATRSHPMRRAIDDQVAGWIVKLRSDPGVVDEAERWKHEMIAHPISRAWVASLWSHGREIIIAQAASEGSELRQRVEGLVTSSGRRILDDEVVRARIDEIAARALTSVVRDHGHEIASLISTTVERWDADDTSRRIEEQIGRDLQFVRINGTVVGGLVGLVIHTVSQAL